MKWEYFSHIFPLVKNCSLVIKERHTREGEHGGDVESWEGHKSFECYKEPYSSELAAKEYGLVVECTDRIFCFADDDLKEGKGLSFSDRDDGIAYLITGVKRWPQHYECLLKAVKGNG